MVERTLTVVTGVFLGLNRGRPHAYYLNPLPELIQRTAGKGVKLVIFADTAAIGHVPTASHVCVVHAELDKLVPHVWPLSRWEDAYAEGIHRYNPVGRRLAQGVVRGLAGVWLAKAVMVRQALQAFPANYGMWHDAGYRMSVHYGGDVKRHRVQPAPPEKFQRMAEWAAGEAVVLTSWGEQNKGVEEHGVNLRAFLTVGQSPGISGGLYLLRQDMADWYLETFSQIWQELVGAQLWSVDESVQRVMVARHNGTVDVRDQHLWWQAMGYA